MSNNFVEHQTLYLNIKLLSITRNISMLWRIVELACGVTWRPCHSFISYTFLQLILKPSLYVLIYLTSLYFWWWRPPRLSRRNHQKYKPQMEQRSAGGHDVIECADCRETITWCSRCVEESSHRLAVKQSQFSEFLLFFALTLSWTTTNKCNIGRWKKGETYRIGSALQQSEMKTIQCSDYAMWWLRGSLHIRWRHTPSSSLFHLQFVFLVVSAR